MEWVLFIWTMWLWYIVCKDGCQQFLPSPWVFAASSLKRWSVSSVLESRLAFDLLWQIKCGRNAVLGLAGWDPYVLTLTRGDAICHVKKPRLSCWGKRTEGGTLGTWPTARKEAPDTPRSPAHIIRKEAQLSYTVPSCLSHSSWSHSPVTEASLDLPASHEATPADT